MQPFERPTGARKRRRPRSTRLRGSAAGLLPEWVGKALLSLLVVGSPLLLGGVPDWAVLTITGTSLFCLAAVLASARDAGDAVAPPVAIAIVGITLWTCVQALPLPCRLVRVIAPESVAAAERAVAALGDASPTCTLTRAPGATHEEILKGVAVAAAFLAAWLLSAAGARRDVLWMLALSTLVMSVVAIGHAVLGAHEVFGVYKPVHVGRTLLVAPLLNLNNLGGFAAFGAPIWMALARREDVRSRRVLCYFAIALTSATALLSLSRGAIAQLMASTGVMVIVTRKRKKDDKNAPGFFSLRQTSVVLAIAAGLGLGMYAVADQLLPELENQDLSKLDLVARAFGFTFDHFWVGVGRGAFSSTFVGIEGTISRFAYAENFVAQWMVEWGVPAALVLLAAIVHAMVTAPRSTGSLTRAGAAVGLIALATQNLVDLAFELLGVSVVAAVALASVVAQRAEHAGQRVAEATRPRARMAALALATLACGVVAAGVSGPRLVRESASAFEDTLRAAIGAQDAAGFRATLAKALHAHPSEPVFPVLAAAEAISRGDASAGRWINRAMQLAPGWTAPHIQAYQWLARHGRRDQALLELRMAAEIHAYAVQSIVCKLAPSDSAAVLAAAPHGRTRKTYFDILGGCVPQPTPTADPIDRAWIESFPDNPHPYGRLSWRLATRGDVDGALAVLDRMAGVKPLRLPSLVIRTNILLALGRHPEAAEAARAAGALRNGGVDPPDMLPAFARAFAHAGDEGAALAAVTDLRRQAGTDVTRLAASYALEGDVRIVLRQPGGAYRAFREAYRISQDTRHLQRVAEVASNFGDRAQALWAYMHLCERRPADTASCSRRDELLIPAQTEHR